MKYCYSCMSEINTDGKCPHCGFDFAGGDYVVQPHQLKPGTVLRDRYIIGKVIGEGGFGITYVARDDFFDEKIAIKEFYMSGFVNRNNTFSTNVIAETGEKGELFNKNKERFYAEAKVLVKFSKIDGISRIKDFFFENDTAYIVMEYLQGKTLLKILKEKKMLTIEETLRYFNPILNALEKVHKENIIHRDISPDNIIITDEGKSKLIDFGSAREFAEDDMKSLSVILKHGYAPEEQYRRRGVQGPWTDVYAICATMYRCISGKRPDDALERLVEDETEELCILNPQCPKKLSDTIMRGISVRAKDRYQCIEELMNDLNGMQQASKSRNISFAEMDSEVTEVLFDNYAEPVKQSVPFAFSRESVYDSGKDDIVKNAVTYYKPVLGSTFIFGYYLQGSSLKIKEPIEWDVLYSDDNASLLISKYILDFKPYNTKYYDVTWEHCSLRRWLNTVFFNTAFDEKQRERIIETSVLNENNPYYGTNGGNNTKDKVFLLSLKNIQRYYVFDNKDRDFHSGCNEALLAKPTQYAAETNKIKDKSGYARWWLRSPGCNNISACIVDTAGITGESRMCPVYYGSIGVRPVIYIKTTES